MRGSIKGISCVLTFAIFILLNAYWFIVAPNGDSMDTGNPYYYGVGLVVFIAIFAIGIYFYSKSKQKKKLKF